MSLFLAIIASANEYPSSNATSNSDPGNGWFGNLLLLILLIAAVFILTTTIRRRRNHKAWRANFSCMALHLYGIHQIKNYKFTFLYITSEMFIVQYKKNIFEVPIRNITGAAALNKFSLSRRGYVFRQGVNRGSRLQPEEVMNNGPYNYARHAVKGTYLAINYNASNGFEELMIFKMNFRSSAAKAAFLLSLHLHLPETERSGNGRIRL